MATPFPSVTYDSVPPCILQYAPPCSVVPSPISRHPYQGFPYPPIRDSPIPYQGNPYRGSCSGPPFLPSRLSLYKGGVFQGRKKPPDLATGGRGFRVLLGIDHFAGDTIQCPILAEPFPSGILYPVGGGAVDRRALTAQYAPLFPGPGAGGFQSFSVCHLFGCFHFSISFRVLIPVMP